MNLNEKVNEMLTSLKGEFCERNDVIEGIGVAALSGEHVLLLGPPGTAKSLLARSFCESIEGTNYFQWLLTRFTPPEELFGPISLQGLKADRYTRVTTGKLPEAHVAFLDEIFKANSAVLNSILTAVEERKFYNDAQVVDIPLLTVIGASNELPQEENLGALYDRFVSRFWVEPVTDVASFTRIVDGARPTASKTRISLEEWNKAQAESTAVKVSNKTKQTLWTIKNVLNGEGIKTSDRRWYKATKLIKSAAWLSGIQEVEEDHLWPLSAALWDQPKDAARVKQAVEKHVNPHLGRAQACYDAIVTQLKSIPDPSDANYMNKLIAVNREVKKASETINKLRDQVSTASGKAKIDQLTTSLDSMIAKAKSAAKKVLEL